MHPAFQVHRLNELGLMRAGDIAIVFDAALTDIEQIVGPLGREIDLARTKMEEACFFAKKALANQARYQA